MIRRRSVLPGFGLTMGYTLLYLSLIVLIPLSGLVFKTATLSGAQFWEIVTSERVLHAYEISFGTALAASLANVVFGLLVAWVLVRYSFPGKRLIDALVDLPFALPTAVAGITLTTLFAETGLFGGLLKPLGIDVAFTPLGIVVALTFIGLPFVVRTLQPVIEDLEPDVEEAAASLGAGRLRTFWHVILPALRPALITGFAQAFARTLGEYGSVVFISGNLPNKTEIAPLMIIGKLEQYDYAGATAIAMVMLVVSFFMLVVINVLQWWSSRHYAE
jgi:sulfate transport system permease protein